MKIKWDEVGKRLYETGVDHGVLFPMGEDNAYGKGVPWYGLSAVNESPSGGEPNAVWADKVKSINAQLASDIQAENDKYENALKSREDSLYKSYGLFDAVKERDEVSGDTLMKNLEGQVKEFGEWQDILESLAGRGLDSGLIEELQDMGPDAIAQIKALNNMSDSELEKYADLWKVKHAMAREQAVGELEGLREETQQNIAKLREEADQELTEYRVLWQEKMNQVTEDANAQLEQLRRSFEEKVGLIKNNTEDELQEMADTAQKVLTEAGWDETGKQIVKGLTEGVQSEKSSFVDEITQLALAGVQAAKSTLDINSPSRVFREIGNYTGLGFVKGLQDYCAQYAHDPETLSNGRRTASAKGGIMLKKQLKNSEMVVMVQNLRPLLQLRNKIGYIAARNFRMLSTALTEYEAFKHDLINKYGEPDKDESGNETGTISIKVGSPNFKAFCDELAPFNEMEHEVELMTAKYEDTIGCLSGEEILLLDWMLED